jgi:C6 transcription factor Pro1
MYKPGILDGGRGWLLALLLRTKPLYHAALALSAYHCQTIKLANLSHTLCQFTSSVQQQEYLELSLKSANQFAQSGCPRNGLGIATAVLELAFYEVLLHSENPQFLY